MKKIAIPVSQEILSPHFGHCEKFIFVSVEDDKIIKMEELASPPHQPGFLPVWLAQNGATDIICGGIGQKAIQLFNQNSINVYYGAEPRSPQELAEAFVNNTLDTGKNLCDH